MKKIFRNSGYALWGIMAISVSLAASGMAGIATNHTYFLSIWALLFALSIFIFIYSVVYISLLWTIISFASFSFSISLLIDFLRGGGLWFPVFDGRLWCIESNVFMAIGAIGFYFSERRCVLLTRGRKIALASFGLTIPVVSALYLCGVPLWLPYLALYGGFGVLLYGFRVPLFWDRFEKIGVQNRWEDDLH